MNKSITQAAQNDKQISKSIKRIFTRFHISSALKAANAYKRKGTPVTEIFQYMFLLIFSNRSMYMSLLTGKNTHNFAKDTVYRFMKMVQINWMRFTTILASRIINNAICSENFRCKAIPYQIAAGRWQKLQFHSYQPLGVATSLSDGGG